MANLELNETIVNNFYYNRKCIVNTDLDGILSGMLLQHFLKWKIVGFSSCRGKSDDELWLKDETENLEDCVFVDLPVYIKNLSVIDQHFVAFDDETITTYNKTKNKINPNVMRSIVFKNANGKSQYTKKYPFGTVHFILAILENLKIIDESFSFELNKNLEGFDLADLILRADRVISNIYYYTFNCTEWLNWIIDIGGKNTNELFEKVKNEYKTRKNRETIVEKKLIKLGCMGIDGDCSNMFRKEEYNLIKKYFTYLGESIGLNPLPVFEVLKFGKLNGKRLDIQNCKLDALKKEIQKTNIFSFAFVSMKALSLTYIEKSKSD